MRNSSEDLDFILPLYPFTQGEQNNLRLWLGELAQWNIPPLKEWWELPSKRLKGKDLRKAALKPIEERWLEEKRRGPRWNERRAVEDPAEVSFEEIRDGRNILGSCPVASEKTRCCNLLTLDAVFRCGFDCSYCSIQSFYSKGKISFHGNLREKLEDLEGTLEKGRLYHIGTGQSSDSLMWGNRKSDSGEGLFEELFRFARRNSQVILEFKSKSDNIEWLLNHHDQIPSNALFTWSLNPRSVVDNEEKGTASLERRLQAARKIADLGHPVGFHFHPMVYFEGWQEEYKALFSRVQAEFKADEVVQISFGTLTYIKPVLKKIRNRPFSSQILRMPLEEIAGKFSYPFELKKEMFRFAYNSFKEWHKREVFFYLCMEDIELWAPVFHRTYENNEEFEQDMLQSYDKKMKKIARLNEPGA
ncbi:MAG: DNA repair photolyase [Spirochaetales bacterium]|nr:DNA repair photolyase [Spirochaetales bacterium]